MPSESVLPRVDYDDVEFDGELALIDGQPFTGVIFELDAAGRLRGESRYREGLPEGLSEDWYPDGQIQHRAIAIRGNGSSETWDWHPNGQMRLYERCVDCYVVESKSWSEDGTLLSHQARPPLDFSRSGDDRAPGWTDVR